MSRGEVDVVVVGADRVANGDTANKIGTYALAVPAQRHGIPFYVACPHRPSIWHWPLATRFRSKARQEITGRDRRWALLGGRAQPAFDVHRPR